MNNKSNKLIYYPYLLYLFLLYLYIYIYIFILFRFSWHKNHGYCWFQTDLDCLNQKPSIVKGDDHGNQGWYCFVVEKYRTQLEARKCSKVTLKYICEQGIACGKRHSEEAFPDSARQRLSNFRRLEQPFCGSSNHEQILPF